MVVVVVVVVVVEEKVVVIVLMVVVDWTEAVKVEEDEVVGEVIVGRWRWS